MIRTRNEGSGTHRNTGNDLQFVRHWVLGASFNTKTLSISIISPHPAQIPRKKVQKNLISAYLETWQITGGRLRLNFSVLHAKKVEKLPKTMTIRFGLIVLAEREEGVSRTTNDPTEDEKTRQIVIIVKFAASFTTWGIHDHSNSVRWHTRQVKAPFSRACYRTRVLVSHLT